MNRMDAQAMGTAPESRPFRSFRPRRDPWAPATSIAAAFCLVLLVAAAAPAAQAAETGAATAAAAAAGAGRGEDQAARTGDPLVVSLDFVVPEYQAGARFRSPATIDTALAEDLARHLGRPLAVVGPTPVTDAETQPKTGAASDGPDAPHADLRITTLDDLRELPPSVAVIPLGYRAAPMAIMRTDSTIRRWEQLRGRTACVAEGGNHVGELQDRYGAIEIVHPSPTDALVALRIGKCDVMVHDSPMLEELIRLPEWRKFSRRLPPRPRSTLALLVPSGNTQAVSRVQDIAEEWKASAFADGLVKNAVRNIAFEVYLEQDVPDCH